MHSDCWLRSRIQHSLLKTVMMSVGNPGWQQCPESGPRVAPKNREHVKAVGKRGVVERLLVGLYLLKP